MVIRNKVNYKLINLMLLVAIIYLVYQTRNFWFGAVSILIEILLPFLIAFVIAYALNPLVTKLHWVPRGIAVFIVLGIFIGIFVVLIWLLSPILLEEVGNIFNGIIAFFKELSVKYNVEFSTIQEQLSTTFNDTLEKLGTYISSGAMNIIGVSVNIISKLFIVMAITIYLLIDMDKIKVMVKRFLLLKNKKLYRYLSIVDKELGNYLSGFIKIVFISFFEYTVLYFIIDHPNFLILGVLAAIMNLIPYFGGIITNVIAAITAFVISPELFIKTCVVFLVFSAVDGYVINPLVYGKSNKLHPLVVIVSVFAFGVLFGTIGIVFALPMAIVIIASYKFFKEDIDRFSKRKLKFKLYK